MVPGHLAFSWGAALWLALPGSAAAGGPYSAGRGDAENPFDAPLPGFADGHVNPLFFGWAAAWEDYHRADGQAPFSDPDLALGAVAGDAFEVVSLGDLADEAIVAGASPGSITLVFDPPIRDFAGADFAVFENAIEAWDGGVFAELAYVEASADGVVFHRFPATSLTPGPVGAYGTIDPTRVRNLAGKHVNAGGESWGTPFDLAEVGLTEASHIRIVDVPGNGAFADADGRPIYDSWLTFGSGGFDLDAVGAISVAMHYDDWPPLARLPAGRRGPLDDPDGDGLPNVLEYALARDPATADAAPATRLARDAEGTPWFVFDRDSRLADLVLEIQRSDDLVAWKTLAVSTGGASFVAVDGQALRIEEKAAPGIRSVGVIRRVSVALPDGVRIFHRLHARLIEP